MSASQTDTPDWPKQALEGQDARDGEACLDWALIQRTLAGEQKAYELLVIKYQKRIERLVARMLRDANQVPDVVQETFINAYRALHQFRGDARFYTWLHRIAVNAVLRSRTPSGAEVVYDSTGRSSGRCRFSLSWIVGSIRSID